MHNNCGEIFSGSVQSQFEFQMSLNHVFWNKWLQSAFLFQFFRDQADSDKGREGGGMAEAGGQQEEEKG